MTIEFNPQQAALPASAVTIEGDSPREARRLFDEALKNGGYDYVIYSKAQTREGILKDAAEFLGPPDDYRANQHPFGQALYDVGNFNGLGGDTLEEAGLYALTADALDGEINGYFSAKQYQTVVDALTPENGLKAVLGGETPKGLASKETQAAVNDLTAYLFAGKKIQPDELPSDGRFLKLVLSVDPGIRQAFFTRLTAINTVGGGKLLDIDKVGKSYDAANRNSELLLAEIVKNPVAAQRLIDTAKQILTRLQNSNSYTPGTSGVDLNDVFFVRSALGEPKQAVKVFSNIITELEKRFN